MSVTSVVWRMGQKALGYYNLICLMNEKMKCIECFKDLSMILYIIHVSFGLSQIPQDLWFSGTVLYLYICQNDNYIRNEAEDSLL